MFNIWFAQPLEEVIENIGEFIPKATEIQSGGRERSPELIAEDERFGGVSPGETSGRNVPNKRQNLGKTQDHF